MAGPLGVRGTSGLEQGDLVESCRPALEESQSARGDLRVVTEPRTSIGVLVCRPQESAGGRLDPAGEPVPPVLQVHPPHPEPEVRRTADPSEADPPSIPAHPREGDVRRGEWSTPAASGNHVDDGLFVQEVPAVRPCPSQGMPLAPQVPLLAMSLGDLGSLSIDRNEPGDARVDVGRDRLGRRHSSSVERLREQAIGLAPCGVLELPAHPVPTTLERTLRSAGAHRGPVDPDIELLGRDGPGGGPAMDAEGQLGVRRVEPGEPDSSRGRTLSGGEVGRSDPVPPTGHRVGEREEPDLVDTGATGDPVDVVLFSHSPRAYPASNRSGCPARGPRMDRPA